MTKLRFIALAIFSFIFLTSAQARIVNVVDYGAAPDDNKDDTEQVQRAFNDVAETGGTIVFPSGTIDLSEGIQVLSSSSYVSFYLKGDRSSVIQLNGRGNVEYFSFVKANQVEFDGLIFLGGGEQQNAFAVISADDVSQTKVTNCAFFNIGAFAAVIDAKDTDLVVEKSMFEGSAAQDSVVRALNSRGLTVSNSTFMAVGYFMNNVYQKSNVQSIDSWIRVANNGSVMPTKGQRISRIVDSRFDEGPKNGILIENQKSVELNGIVMNIRQESEFAGVNLINVEYADVKNSKFISKGVEKKAMDLKSHTFAMVNSLTFSDGMQLASVDGSSSYQIGFCPACSSLKTPKLRK